MRKTFAATVLLSLLYLPTSLFGQAKDDIAFCDKKWFCEMTKDADGTIHPPEAGTENDYMHFRCDSTFVLSENKIVLKGKWTFDDNTNTITLLQSQINTIPEKISYHIIDYDEGHLVVIGQEGTDQENTAYFYSK